MVEAVEGDDALFTEYMVEFRPADAVTSPRRNPR